MTSHQLGWVSLACCLSFLAWPAPSMAANRIRLDADMVTNLSGLRPALELVDEQDLAGDPRTGDAVSVPPRRVPVFKVSKELKDMVSQQ